MIREELQDHAQIAHRSLEHIALWSDLMGYQSVPYVKCQGYLFAEVHDLSRRGERSLELEETRDEVFGSTSVVEGWQSCHDGHLYHTAHPVSANARIHNAEHLL